MEAALKAGRRAVGLTAADTELTYLANQERQYAIERLLIRFGEALKDVSPETLLSIEPTADWSGPKAFRDLAAHWYEDGLDHGLIWRALKLDMPPLLAAIERWLASVQGSQ